MKNLARQDVLVCGAGIAGIAAAHQLTVKHGFRNVLLVDERPPLSLTSDKSSECYRNWWPGPDNTMVRFMNRSIDLLENLAAESDNYFQMNRRGYIFLTADQERANQLLRSAQAISDLGAGELRIHDGREGASAYTKSPPYKFHKDLNGADLVLDPGLIQTHYPFLADDMLALLHPRRCGWLSAQQLGMYLLRQAQEHGARLLRGRVIGVTSEKGRVHSVRVDTGDAVTDIETEAFVNAAGPLLRQVGAMIGIDLPVFNELHGKIIFEDHLNLVPRDAPMMILSDPVKLPWSKAEKQELLADVETRWLTHEFPGGVHFRPEGGSDAKTLLMLWTYHLDAVEPIWPLPDFGREYPEIVLRGLSRMIPALSVYFDKMSKPDVDGGYYCKTRENRPLIGPLPVEGTYVIGALSGYGIMAAMAAGELLADHVAGSELPSYAPSMLLSRYDDPSYRKLIEDMGAASGQL